MVKRKGFGADAEQLSRLMYGKSYNSLDKSYKRKVRIKKKVLG